MKNKPNAVDVKVGARLRQRRIELGLSQTEVGNAVGVSFQQIQKYENGMNRIGASRLQQLAQVLKTRPALFFDDVPLGVPYETFEDDLTEFVSSDEGRVLSRSFSKIRSKDLRRSIVRVVECLAQT